MSGGGFFESRDGGADWTPLNSGVAMDFAPVLPDGAEYPFGHDPHCVQMHPLRPDRLWRQDHCGLYRLDRDRSARWERVGKAMPPEVGDIGFPIAAHPRDPDTAWVFPMDGTSVWPRTSREGIGGARPGLLPPRGPTCAHRSRVVARRTAAGAPPA